MEDLKTLLDLVNRIPVPEPWEEGDNIPWDEPGFSQRMLAEHLSQEHDAASRRFLKIEEHVRWIHSQVIKGRATRVLDLCCGPGLYTSRLAALGHECVGIDFSPAAIAYAEEEANAKALPCRYLREDVRRAEFGAGFGLVMMVFGQVNVFRRGEAHTLLGKARRALADNGILLLEAHTLAAVERMGTGGTSWYSAAEGLFSPQPHLVLEESFWDAAIKAATTRHFVVDASSGLVTRHAISTQGYSDDEYVALLRESSFADVQCFPSLTGEEDPAQSDFLVLTARAMANS
jgi:SAM-dependent methyltransferase